MIDGYVAPGFEAVRDEFRTNFARRGELGAAVAAYVGGTKVVDLWGGYRDFSRQDRWEEDTLVLVYSTSKGMAAVAMAVAASRGLFDYDAAVASYWPEFAQNGKGAITVRQLLAHQAGLSGVDAPLNARVLADLDGLGELLAAQKPAWEPGTRQGYHALTIGWYESALLRRVDPRGRSVGPFFAEEVAAPLGLEFYFGLPASVPRDRVARIKGASAASLLTHVGAMPARMMASFLRPGSHTARAFMNPRMRGPADLDRDEYRAVEIPAGGGIGQVRSIARTYSEMASGGAALGVSPSVFEDLTAPPRPPSGGVRDLVLWVPAAYSLGFVRPSGEFRFGLGPRSFGHPGAGGSFGFADPEAEVGFAYAPNRLGHHLRDDPREKALREALYRCLDRAPARRAIRSAPASARRAAGTR